MIMFDRSHVENILNEKLESYIKEFESDMKFDERNIHEKTLERSSIAAKWCRFSYEEEKYKKKILESVEKLKEQTKNDEDLLNFECCEEYKMMNKQSELTKKAILDINQYDALFLGKGIN